MERLGILAAVLALCVLTTEPAPAASVTREPGTKADSDPLVSLGSREGWPAFLSLDDKTVAFEDGGVRFTGRHYARTTSGEWLGQDFVFDVVFTIKQGDQITFIGLGTGERTGPYNEPAGSVYFRIHPPNVAGGSVNVARNPMDPGSEIGAIKKAGTHLARIEKRGKAVTFALDADYDGNAFKADFSRKFEDITAFDRRLKDGQAHLFFGAGGSYRQVRLVGGGAVPAPGREAPAVKPGPVATANPKSDPAAKVAPPPATRSSGLVIVEAKWGREDKWLDVTRRLSERVREGRLFVSCTNEAMGGDPFPNKPKTLHVVYRIAGVGQEMRATGEENSDLLLLAPAAPVDVAQLRKEYGEGLVVLAAQWGAGGRWADVTKALRGRVTNNALKVTVAEAALGADPAQGTPKWLYVLYLDNDQVRTATYADFEAVELRGSRPSIMAKLTALPARVAEGQAVAHRFEAGAATYGYELLAGPKGLALSRDGAVTWTPTAEQVGPQEVRLVVTAGSRRYEETVEVEVVSREVFAAAGGDWAKVDQLLRLPVKPGYRYVAGLGDAGALLLEEDQLTVLEPDGLSVRSRHKLAKPYLQIAERAEYYVAVSKQPIGLDLLDKTTLKPIRTVKLNYPEVTDLACHPASPISYVAVRFQHEVPRYRIVVVDEQAGEAREPKEAFGTWLAVDPSGRYLYAGYKDIYEKGQRFFVNPDGRVIDTPEYGSIDLLVRYELRNGQPKLQDIKEKAGGNGEGIRLSRDGKRITYLSYVGYPQFSNNLGGWDPTDLEKNPVSYPTGKHAGPHALEFHPALPVAAAPGKTGLVLFDRESGDVLEGKVALPASVAEQRMHRVMFAPDGRSLIVELGPDGGRYLRKVPLRLSAEELAGLARKRVIAGARPVDPATKVPAADLSALEPKAGKAMSPKEIVKASGNAVVLIEAGDATGSGFVVGAKGYVLTAAHVVSGGDEVTVTYSYEVAGKTKTAKANAAVLTVDAKADLALLKIESPAPLLPVVLADAKAAVDSGDPVTVIGNPAVGQTVLTQTVTTGVVSNPARQIEGRTYLQTSAAVNPGNSGGPLFDAQGQVIGLVSLKANIEGAGFAVPVKELRAFLAAAAAK